MAHSSFGSGWPNCNRSNVVTIVRADGLRLPIHRDLVDLVTILLDLTEALGYDVIPGWTWGYACRAIANTKTPSNHSWATAVDVNAPNNPRRADRKFQSDIPRAIVDLWKAHGFRWGGDFSWPDPMHFEFMGTTEQARAIAVRLRRFLSAQGGGVNRPTPIRPGVPAYPGVVRMGSSGPAVRVWQEQLRRRGYQIVADGRFGPATNHALRDWQRKRGLAVDGVGGTRTWHQLVHA